MANKIKLKHGLKANMPKLEEAEPGFTTDTGELYIGTASGKNVPIGSQSYDIDGILETVRLDAGRRGVYGVSFSGERANGYRLCDAVGLVANIGIDDEKAYNDFDYVFPWSEKKRCNGDYDPATGQFIVSAYKGDANYAEDGSNGNVWVEWPAYYYKHTIEDDTETILIAKNKIDEDYDLPAKCIDGNGNILDKVYLPAYEAGKDENGNPVSISGVEVANWSYNTMKNATDNMDGDYCMYSPADHEFISYLWQVEFATRNSQGIMRGNVDRTSTNLQNDDEYKAITINEVEPISTDSPAFTYVSYLGSAVNPQSNGISYLNKGGIYLHEEFGKTVQVGNHLVLCPDPYNLSSSDRKTFPTSEDDVEYRVSNVIRSTFEVPTLEYFEEDGTSYEEPTPDILDAEKVYCWLPNEESIDHTGDPDYYFNDLYWELCEIDNWDDVLIAYQDAQWVIERAQQYSRYGWGELTDEEKAEYYRTVPFYIRYKIEFDRCNYYGQTVSNGYGFSVDSSRTIPYTEDTKVVLIPEIERYSNEVTLAETDLAERQAAYIAAIAKPSVTGETDNVVASSGCAVANDGRHSIIYRGMENPWGNTGCIMGGIMSLGPVIYWSKNPRATSVKNNISYVKSVDYLRPSSLSIIENFNISANGKMLPYRNMYLVNTTGSENEKYHCDALLRKQYIYYDTTNTCSDLRVNPAGSKTAAHRQGDMGIDTSTGQFYRCSQSGSSSQASTWTATNKYAYNYLYIVAVGGKFNDGDGAGFFCLDETLTPSSVVSGYSSRLSYYR